MAASERKEDEDYLVCRICGDELRSLGYHINRVHNVTGAEYRSLYGNVPLTCKATRTKCSASLSRSQTNYESLSHDEILERLCELSTVVTPITYTWLQRNGHAGLAGLCDRYLGGLPKALEMLGLEKATREKWSKERIAEEIQKREAAGEDLGYVGTRRACPTLVCGAEQHFGGWSTALKAAGIDPKKYLAHYRRSEDEWREEFEQWVNKHGPLSFARLRKTGNQRLYTKAKKAFGSLEAAAKAYGLPFTVRRSLSQKVVIARLQARVMRGEPINSGALQKEDYPLYSAMEKHWGSHRKCLAALGYNVDVIDKTPVKWTRERVEEGLKAWVEKHKKVDGVKLRRDKRQLAYGASKLFGSPEAAAAEFGLPYGKATKPTIAKKGVIRRLRTRLRKKLSTKVKDLKREDPKLYAAAAYHYGSVTRALELAKAGKRS